MAIPVKGECYFTIQTINFRVVSEEVDDAVWFAYQHPATLEWQSVIWESTDNMHNKTETVVEFLQKLLIKINALIISTLVDLGVIDGDSEKPHFPSYIEELRWHLVNSLEVVDGKLVIKAE